MTEQILFGARIYQKQSGLSLSTISNQMMGYGQFLKRLENGKGMTTRIYERAKLYLVQRGVDFESHEKE